MSEETKKCSYCGGELQELLGGLVYCPKCGFKGEPPRAVSPLDKPKSPLVFWILMLSPAGLALISFLLGQISRNLRGVGVLVGCGALFVGLVASFYCAWWMATRFSRNSGSQLMIMVLLIPVIGALNFIIIFAGCASNVDIGH